MMHYVLVRGLSHNLVPRFRRFPVDSEVVTPCPRNTDRIEVVPGIGNTALLEMASRNTGLREEAERQ